MSVFATALLNSCVDFSTCSCFYSTLVTRSSRSCIHTRVLISLQVSSGGIDVDAVSLPRTGHIFLPLFWGSSQFTLLYSLPQLPCACATPGYPIASCVAHPTPTRISRVGIRFRTRTLNLSPASSTAVPSPHTYCFCIPRFRRSGKQSIYMTIR